MGWGIKPDSRWPQSKACCLPEVVFYREKAASVVGREEGWPALGAAGRDVVPFQATSRCWALTGTTYTTCI